MMLHRRPFVKTIESLLAGDCCVEPGDRILAAVSGGADSVAMAHALATLAGRKQWMLDLHIAHVNHHLRDDADADERFVADLAAMLKLPFHRADIHPAVLAGNLEANARNERYAALLNVAADIDADTIATAHHADDQLETMLMRLIRGTSVHGLTGILPRRQIADHHALIRPMLDVDHAQAVKFLQSFHQPWREDRTNADTSRWRAKLRAEVLPALKSMRPGAAFKAVQTARHLHDAALIISRLTRDAMDDFVEVTFDGAAKLGRDEARRLNTTILAELTRHLCIFVGSTPDNLSTSMIDPIVEAMQDGSGEMRVFQLPGRMSVQVDAMFVWWKPIGGAV